MNEKRKTIDEMKKKREAPGEVREKVKAFAAVKKAILKALGEGLMTIPQIAEKTGLEQEAVTYHLMTMRKFGAVETDEIDDMDEYYLYRVKGKTDGQDKS